MSASGSEPLLIFFDYLLYTTEAEGTPLRLSRLIFLLLPPLPQPSLRRPASPPVPLTRPPGRRRRSAARRCSAALSGLFPPPPPPSPLDIGTSARRALGLHESESSIWLLHIDPLSNAATVADTRVRIPTSSRPCPSASESKREAELRRRNEALQAQRETDALPHPQRSRRQE